MKTGEIFALVSVPVMAFRVEAECPECPDGRMKATGCGSTNNLGTFWEHMCTICKHTDVYSRRYPLIEHREVS